METNNNLHQQAVDMMTWGLLHDLNFKNILDKCSPEQQKLIYEISELVRKTKFDKTM